MSNTVFTFGKHKGKSVHQVRLKDPDYLNWVVSTPDVCRRYPAIVSAIQKASTSRNILRSIVSLNINRGRCDREEIEDLKDLLMFVEPDIICFQEVTEELLNKLDLESYSIHLGCHSQQKYRRRDKKIDIYFNVTLFRNNRFNICLKVEQIDIGSDRTAIMLIFHEHIVVNLHLKAGRGELNIKTRSHQIDIILNEIRKYREFELILVGDFNFDSSDEESCKKLADFGLKKPILVPTYYCDNRYGYAFDRYYTKGVDLPFVTRFGSKELSDHYGIMAMSGDYFDWINSRSAFDIVMDPFTGYNGRKLLHVRNTPPFSKGYLHCIDEACILFQSSRITPDEIKNGMVFGRKLESHTLIDFSHGSNRKLEEEVGQILKDESMYVEIKRGKSFAGITENEFILYHGFHLYIVKRSNQLILVIQKLLGFVEEDFMDEFKSNRYKKLKDNCQLVLDTEPSINTGDLIGLGLDSGVNLRNVSSRIWFSDTDKVEYLNKREEEPDDDEEYFNGSDFDEELSESEDENYFSDLEF